MQRLDSATQPGPAPGEIVTLFGTGIGPAVLVGVRLTPAGFFDNSLADTRVLFDGVAAPLVYVSERQTSAIVPYAVAGKASTQIQVEYQGRQSPPVTLPVAASAPALFSLNAGRGGGAILNQDSTVNTAANPAEKGSIVVLYGTGEGQTDPAGVDGKLASGTFPKPVLPVSVTIGGQAADILYYGAAPGLVAGVMQVNARIPYDNRRSAPPPSCGPRT